MKKFLICSIILGSVIIGHTILSSNRPPQDRRFTLSLTEQEINVALKGLGELPLKESQPVYGTIMQQAQSQLQPPPKVQQPALRADTSKPKPKKQ
jgi:hypothetical protein